MYFADLYANFFDPSIGEATVAVLQHNGFDVFVPAGQRSSGLESLVHGDVETAREAAIANVRSLAEGARIGWPIVCSEPSAALMIRSEYPHLLRDADAHAVSDACVELSAFLGRLHGEGRLMEDLHSLPAAIGHHVPCHIKAAEKAIAGPDLLALIPGASVRTIDVGCSGMAGVHGLKTHGAARSRIAGGAMLSELSSPRHLFGSSECSTCRLQIEEGAGKVSLHPVQYLALAYGLMPALADRLRHPLRTTEPR